jgi:hypothetical protein
LIAKRYPYYYVILWLPSLRNRRHAVRFCLCSGRLQAGRLSPLRLLRMQRSVFESASFLERSVSESASSLEDPPKEGRQIPPPSRRALFASRMTVREGISLAPAFIVAVTSRSCPLPSHSLFNGGMNCPSGLIAYTESSMRGGTLAKRWAIRVRRFRRSFS